MEYQEILQNARTCMGPYCKACPVCNGQACKNTIPGPGAKGSGTGFARNYQKWQELRVNLDTIGENRRADTSFDFFGHRLALPVMAAPVGAMQLHYGDKYDDLTYNRLLLAACAKAGIVAFTGDGVDPAVMEGATQAIRAQQGCGVPTVKPWDRETLMQKLDLALTADPMAIAMDIDAAGLPFLRNRMPPAGSKTVAELREVAEHARKPLILKGIMTVRGAEKAVEAGASAIVVSNHGGRVLDQCPATAEVLPAIADAVGDRVMVLVDGGTVNPLPLNRVRRESGDVLVAVDVSAPFSDEMAARVRSSLNYYKVITASSEIMQQHIARLMCEIYKPDLLIELPADRFGIFEFYRAREIVEAGRLAARAALEQHMVVAG